MNRKAASQAFFVTGTDTDVGKTLVATALLRAGVRSGLRAIGVKPLAAGCFRQDAELRNDDALALQAAANVSLRYAQVNPLAFEPFTAPHLAAADNGIPLDAGTLIEHCRQLRADNIDLMVIEGAGGWFVPLNDTESLADVAVGLKVPVILVVGMKLGCLNHALLTFDAISRSGVSVAGWVANSTQPEMDGLDGNIRTLERRFSAPHLGTIPFLGMERGDDAADAYLNFEQLLQTSNPG
jgi:dethiobiotin synthetase